MEKSTFLNSIKLYVLSAILLLIVLFGALLPCDSIAFAQDTDYAPSVPYVTTTAGPEGSLVTTQVAYVPSSQVVLSAESSYGALLNPEDMAVDEDFDRIYIADTGNKRIVVADLSGNVVDLWGVGTLSQPTGVAVDTSRVYVCDKTNEKIYVYNKNGTLNKEIGRPDSVLLGASTDFKPTKLSVDERENLYVVSEGSVSGIMQINLDGDFVGYIGSNSTEVSLVTALQNLFYSEEQVNAFLKTPRSPTNVTIDARGLVYTVTNSASSSTVKKLNTLGNSIMSPSVNFSDTYAACVDSSENIYTVQTDGYVTIYDSEGNLLFRFGGSLDERFGALKNPVSVQVLSDGRLLVLDKTYKMVVVFRRTDFADLVFKAVDFYKDGLYLDGEPYWQEVLQHNSSFILAYKALARANMKKENYQLALTQFKFAEDKSGYSEAYWQIRNAWLEKNLGWVILAIVIVIILVAVWKILDKKTKVILPVKEKLGGLSQVHIKNVYPFKELAHTRRFCRATDDAVYEVKYHSAASVWMAMVLYLWMVALQILSVYTKGYLFNSVSAYSTNGWSTVLIIAGSFLLLVICNYFVATVTDGEGKLKYCFISFVYALSPYLIMALPVFVVTNVLTYNESIVYYILEAVMYGWTAICIFRTIMELHDYTFWQTVKNILLTVFAFLMALLFFIILRMLFTQFFGYFAAVIEEVINNVL